MIKKQIIIIIFICAGFQAWSNPPSQTVYPHEKAVNVPADLQRNAKTNPAAYLGSLVDYLTGEAENDYQKVKIIHDWISLNISYDARGYFGQSRIVYNTYDVIKTGRSVCSGYANVLEEMCRLGGIEAVIITGYGRGVSFDPLNISETFTANHAWNGVKIKDQWYLVDATWDAGYLKGSTFVRSYGTGYLFTEPENFIYTHYPSDKKWQLLKKPLSFDQFKTLPYLKDKFFNLGMEPPEDLPLLKTVEKHYELNIKAPSEVVAMANLVTETGQVHKDKVFVQREGEALNIKCVFPSPGKYLLRIYAKTEDDPGRYWQAAEFSFKATGGTERSFPLAYSSFYQFKASIAAPVLNQLPRGNQILFDVYVPGAEVVGVNNGRDFIDLQPQGEGHFTGKISIEGKETFLYYKEGNYRYLVKWDNIY